MIISPLDLILMACATWYISYVITAQNGPFLVFAKMRQWGQFGGLLSCIYCVAPYVAGIVYVAMRYTSEGVTLVQIFAIAGLSLMLRSYTGAGMNGL